MEHHIRTDDNFLVKCLTLHIKGDFVNNISVNYIINEFYALKLCWTQFRWILNFFCCI